MVHSSKRPLLVPILLKECTVPRGVKTSVPGPISDSLPLTDIRKVPSSTKKYSSRSRCRWGGGPSPGLSSTMIAEKAPPVATASSMIFISRPKGRIGSAVSTGTLRGARFDASLMALLSKEQRTALHVATSVIRAGHKHTFREFFKTPVKSVLPQKPLQQSVFLLQ